MTDQQVIDALGEDDEAAMQALDHVFDRHRHKVTGYLASKEIAATYPDPAALAYDLFIESLMALRENVRAGRLTSFNAGGMGTYLTTICRYKYYAKVRKDNKETAPPLLFADNETVDEELHLALRRHVRELGDKCRELLSLFYFDRLPMREVILLTNHPYGSVATANVANQRCRKSLKMALQTYLQTRESTQHP